MVDGLPLILHDTTEFRFYGELAQELGALCEGFQKGGKEQYVVRGILMHASLVVTIEGLPLGLCAIKLWTRDRFKGTNAPKQTIDPTRVRIEEKENVCWLDSLRLSTKLLGRWMTMMNRVAPTSPPALALTETETRLRDRLIPDRTGQ